jgi:hypothetical protein
MVRETGLTVLPNDILEVTPLAVHLEQRELERALTTTQDNMVCTKWKDIFKEECKREKEVCIKGECYGDGRVVCRKVKTGQKCVRQENRWVRTTEFSMGVPTLAAVESPVGKITELFEGIHLKFNYGPNSSKAPVVCAMSSFARKGSGKNLALRIENRPGCEIFREDSDESPMVSIMNRVSFPTQYRSGRYVDNWQGQVLEQPAMSTYHPEVRLNLDLGIRGAGFGSSAAAGRRMQ